MGMLVINEVWSGVLLAHYYSEASESDCAIGQQKPGLKSMAQHFTVILRIYYQDSNMYQFRWVHTVCTLCLIYTHGHAVAHKHAKD